MNVTCFWVAFLLPFGNQRRTYQYIAPAQIGGITFLENKTAAAKRRQSQQNVFAQPEQQQAQPFQATPVDADEPF